MGEIELDKGIKSEIKRQRENTQVEKEREIEKDKKGVKDLKKANWNKKNKKKM